MEKLKSKIIMGIHPFKTAFLCVLLIQMMSTTCFAQEQTRYELHLFNSSPLELKETSEKFEIAHPELKYKIVFYAPNAILVVGSCETLVEIRRLKKELIMEYPDSKIMKCLHPKPN